MYRLFCKRLFDLAIVIPSLIILLPALLLLVTLVRYKLGAPAIFRQVRPGLGGKPFTMYKFRTMSSEHDIHGHLLPDAQRLTPFGRALRLTSLDGLPQLFNVLKGEMSLVGPRPLQLRDFEPHSFEQLRRHEVRPGVTSWARLKGQNARNWVATFNLDAEYVERCSLWLDLSILVLSGLEILDRLAKNRLGEITTKELQRP